MEATENLSEEDVLRAFVRGETGVAPEDDDPLVEQGFIASAKLLDLVALIEERFGLVLGAADVVPDNMQTIRTMARMVRSARAEAAMDHPRR